jgi:predicted O-linked N-acetylglucosamine transferase (SPINDLY family)
MAERGMPTEGERLLQQALMAYRQQNHVAASAGCQKLLEIDPDDADAWHLLGAIDLQRGDFVSASLKFGKAAAREPARAEFHKNLARAQFGSGLQTDSAASARRAIELNSADADAWNILGLSLETTDPAAALAAFERAVELAPHEAEAHFRIGDFWRRRRDFDSAIAAYRSALAIAPNHAVLRNNLALALQEQGHHDEAEAHYRAAIEQQPGLVEALANLGDLCRTRDRTLEAIACFRQAVAASPNVVELWKKLGICQHRQGQLSDAKASFERALALAPDDPKNMINLASVLLAEFRHPEAASIISQALTLQPELAEAQSMLLYVNQHMCQWQDFDQLFLQQRARLEDPAVPPVVPHNLLALPYTSAELLTASRKWVAQHIRPKPAAAPVPWELADNKLRIGYLGSDFHTHPLANLLTEVLEVHDRERFEVFGYSFGPNDRSPARARFIRAFDRFVDVRAESFDQTAQRIRDDRIAILMDTGGYVLYARSEIFALHPAPIQINCIGFAGTLGADYYDYILCDRVVTPAQDQEHFAERFMLLPNCYMPGDTRRAIASTPTRAECGLPAQGVVFCCFNASYKILPNMFAIWMRILEEVPGSVLWLLESNPSATENLRREAKSRNVSPERLIFAPRVPLALHLARHSVADLFLDTLPYSAHTTANDALFAGLPVLTCAGDTFAGRVSGSHLRAIGLPELVTHNLDDYVALALELARDPSLLHSYRERLRGNRETFPLFDTVGYTRALEQLLIDAWEERMKGIGVTDATPRATN